MTNKKTDRLRFVILKNNFKEKDTHPDFRLYLKSDEHDFLEIGGVWTRTSKESGDKYLSGSFDKDVAFSSLPEPYEGKDDKKDAKKKAKKTEDDDTPF